MPVPAPDPPAPALTDRAALDRQRARAIRAGLADVLHRFVAAEVQDRLAEVNRPFHAPAVVSGLPALWADLWPGARSVADTPVLDLAPGAHDLVLHALALHWADDPVGQIVQCARALRPDGLFLAACPGGASLAGLRAALAEAEVAVSGGLSPRVVPMGEIRDLGALPARAGLALPVADSVPVTLSHRDALHLMRDLRAMGEGNALAARHRRPSPRALFARAAAAYAAQNPDRDDPSRVATRIDLVFLTAWAPAPSQPRPLRPGSARTSLAAVLPDRGPAPA